MIRCNVSNYLLTYDFLFQRSPTDQQIPFSRDAFGRQSMSEKRHGHIDPRISEFYKKLKETRGQPIHSGEIDTDFSSLSLHLVNPSKDLFI